nr:hypothetical protein [Nitrosomonas nitrosa]
MFKKSHNQGDKTPKQENKGDASANKAQGSDNKDHVSKVEPAAGNPASTAQTTAPANEAKKS